MRSELQFFMAEEDEADFLKYAGELVDDRVHTSPSFDSLMVGDVPIQFQPSKRKSNLIEAGRIAIATDGFGLEYIESERAEKAFNGLRRWIKKRYLNKLKHKGYDDKIRVFWVGPTAYRQKSEQCSLIFKQFEQSTSELEIDERNI